MDDEKETVFTLSITQVCVDDEKDMILLSLLNRHHCSCGQGNVGDAEGLIRN
jgi:hypothetical protein